MNAYLVCHASDPVTQLYIPGPPVGQIQGVANALKRIGDELDGDDELQR